MSGSSSIVVKESVGDLITRLREQTGAEPSDAMVTMWGATSGSAGP